MSIMSHEHSEPAKKPRRLGWFSWLAVSTALLAYAIESISTEHLLAEFTPDGKSAFYEFGWPRAFVQAEVEIAVADDSWFAIAHGVHPQFLVGGAVCDLAFCAWLLITAVFAMQWFEQKLRPRLTLGLLLGLVAYLGYELRFRWKGFAGEDEPPLYVAAFVTIVYAQKLTHVFILIACLWTPHVIGQVIGTAVGWARRRGQRSHLAGCGSES